MIPRTLRLDEAANLITDGMTVAFGGMTIYRRPLAFVRAMLRRPIRPKDLTLLCFTASLESDLLVGAGCVGTVRSCYFGLESFGFAPMFTQAAQTGTIRIMEETEVSLSQGIRAGIQQVGYLPSRAWVGTDLPRLRPDVKMVTDPYTQETLMAFPAIACDVAVIHGLEADPLGNVTINLNVGVDVELVYLAKTVIFTVERLVDTPLERTTDRLLIPSPGADIIVHAPRGAWPTSCYPDYPVGGGEFMRYVDACNAGEFQSYVESILNMES